MYNGLVIITLMIQSSLVIIYIVHFSKQKKQTFLCVEIFYCRYIVYIYIHVLAEKHKSKINFGLFSVRFSICLLEFRYLCNR